MAREWCDESTLMGHAMPSLLLFFLYITQYNIAWRSRVIAGSSVSIGYKNHSYNFRANLMHNTALAPHLFFDYFDIIRWQQRLVWKTKSDLSILSIWAWLCRVLFNVCVRHEMHLYPPPPHDVYIILYDTDMSLCWRNGWKFTAGWIFIFIPTI